MNQNNIKPQELMLGNWVQYDKQYFQIDSIAEVFPTLNTDKFGIGVVDYNNIKPIPLSEEVLIQHGFKPTEDNAGLTLWSNDEDNYWSITWYRNNLVSISSTLRGSGFSGLTLTNVEYFHELQNAIYLATKKDWEVRWT